MAPPLPPAAAAAAAGPNAPLPPPLYVSFGAPSAGPGSRAAAVALAPLETTAAPPDVPPFGGSLVRAETVMATGGVVSAVAFAPRGKDAEVRGDHHLVVAVHPPGHARTAMRCVYEGEGTMQLWKVKVTRGVGEAPPRAVATCRGMLRHNGLVCNSLDFRPRMPHARHKLAGVLACCLGNGALSIYRIPTESFEGTDARRSQNLSLTDVTKADATEWAPGTEPSPASPSTRGSFVTTNSASARIPPAPFVSVKWMPDPPEAPGKRGRHLIAAGKQDGTVALIAVVPVDPLAEDEDEGEIKTVIVATLNVDSAQTVIVRSLAFAPPSVRPQARTHQALLATGNARGVMRVYELDAYALLGVPRTGPHNASCTAPLEATRCLREWTAIRCSVNGITWSANRGLGEATAAYEDGSLTTRMFCEIKPSARHGMARKLRMSERVFRGGGMGMGPTSAIMENGSVQTTTTLLAGTLSFVCSAPIAVQKEADGAAAAAAPSPTHAATASTPEAPKKRKAKDEEDEEDEDEEADDDEDNKTYSKGGGGLDESLYGATRHWLCFGGGLGELGLASSNKLLPVRKLVKNQIYPIHLCAASQCWDPATGAIVLRHGPRADTAELYKMVKATNAPDGFVGSATAHLHGSNFDGRIGHKTSIKRNKNDSTTRERMKTDDTTVHAHAHLFVPRTEEAMVCGAWACTLAGEVPMFLVGAHGFCRLLLFDLDVASERRWEHCLSM